MLGPGDAHIDPVLLLDELTGSGTHHGHKDEVELAALRAVDRQDLVVDILVSKVLGDGILLRIVWSNHIHRVLRELHQCACLWVLTPLCMVLCKLLQAEILEGDDGLNLSNVVEACAFESLTSMGYIDEQERRLREHELLVWVGLIAALDTILIEEQVRHLHKRLVHAILDVEEVVWVP